MKRSGHTGCCSEDSSEHQHGTTRPKDFSVEGILSLLKSEGMRITQSRRQILDVLFAAKEPLSLQELCDQATHQGKGPDYATVFRMASLLEEHGIVHKVNLQKSCSYYELNDPSKHYDHVVCTECDRVVVIDSPCPVSDTEREIARRYGFSNLKHSLEFFGKCPDCSDSSQE